MITESDWIELTLPEVKEWAKGLSARELDELHESVLFFKIKCMNDFLPGASFNLSRSENVEHAAQIILCIQRIESQDRQ